MEYPRLFGTRKLLLASAVALVAVLAGAMLFSGGATASDDPAPSPLFQQSLDASVEQMDDLNRTKPKAPQNVEVALAPTPQQLNKAAQRGVQIGVGSAGAPQLSIVDGLETFALIGFAQGPDPINCELGPIFGELEGLTEVQREAPPYSTGVDIPIEIVQLELTSVAPVGPFGQMELSLHPDQPSPGAVTNVVAGGTGEFVSGDAFFDVWPIITLPDLGGQQLESRVQPIQMQAPSINALPPIPANFFSSSGPVPLFFTTDPPSAPPTAWICFVEHQVLDSAKYCIYEATCVSGPPDSINMYGICVGDRRKLSACPNGTCATGLATKQGSVCIQWSFVACEPTTLPDIPGPFGACECTPMATMPSSPSCPGASTCPGNPSCPGTASCEGEPSCPETASCPYFPSCNGYYTCTGEGVTCPGNVSCPGTPSCPYYPSCSEYPSCQVSTCPASPTCPWYVTCGGTATCVDFASCDYTPPIDAYEVVYSVTDVINPAEGLLVPGHPEPNDVYSLGPFGGYQTGGELFQSSGAILGAPPDLTNVDRISSALGLGPAPLGGPPFVGPFAPSTGAPAPAPAPPGGLGTFGLSSGDNVNALSFGIDGGSVLLFSVNTVAIGLPATAVSWESQLSPAAPPIGPGPPSAGGGDPGNEAAGDVFRSTKYRGFGAGVGHLLSPTLPNTNGLEIDEELMGLQAPAIAHSLGLGIAEDDLDALEADDAAEIDPDVDGLVDDNAGYAYFSLDPLSVQIGLPDPYPGLCTGGDVDGVTTDDILISEAPGFGAFTHAIFIRGVADIGLLPGDDLDALCLFDAVPLGVLDASDEILFSLAGGSPSLVPGANPAWPIGANSPGDVLFWSIPTGITRYASPHSLGLFDEDELDALDIGSCADTCGTDFDSDGLNNPCDNCPDDFNPGQSDVDGDGVGDICDNCPNDFNPAQLDSNGNLIGDVCDVVACDCPFQGDYDSDGFLTSLDLGQLIDVLFAGMPEIQDPNCPTSRGDLDCDGFPTSLDLGLLIDHLFAGGPGPCDPCAVCGLPSCP